MQGFHQRLRQLRRSKQLTLDALAKELDTTKTTLSRYENNKRLPDADFIAKTATYFNVSADYLLMLTDHPTTIRDFLSNQIADYKPLSDAEIAKLRQHINNLTV